MNVDNQDLDVKEGDKLTQEIIHDQVLDNENGIRQEEKTLMHESSKANLTFNPLLISDNKEELKDDSSVDKSKDDLLIQEQVKDSEQSDNDETNYKDKIQDNINEEFDKEIKEEDNVEDTYNDQDKEDNIINEINNESNTHIPNETEMKHELETIEVQRNIEQINDIQELNVNVEEKKEMSNIEEHEVNSLEEAKDDENLKNDINNIVTDSEEVKDEDEVIVSPSGDKHKTDKDTLSNNTEEHLATNNNIEDTTNIEGEEKEIKLGDKAEYKEEVNTEEELTATRNINENVLNEPNTSKDNYKISEEDKTSNEKDMVDNNHLLSKQNPIDEDSFIPKKDQSVEEELKELEDNNDLMIKDSASNEDAKDNKKEAITKEGSSHEGELPNWSQPLKDQELNPIETNTPLHDKIAVNAKNTEDIVSSLDNSRDIIESPIKSNSKDSFDRNEGDGKLGTTERRNNYKDATESMFT